MPELPDVVVYVERLAAKLGGEPIENVRVASPFVVRSFDPPVREIIGKQVRGVRRLGKRVVFALSDDLFAVIHLMVAGRFRFREAEAKIPGKIGLLAFDFKVGTLLLTEASTKKRASLYVVRGEQALRALAPDGLEVLDATLEAFSERLVRENHTVKRALTDPRLFSGIGNAYSDEILHRAKMSPVTLTQKLKPAAVANLLEATRTTLLLWCERLRKQVGDGFPEKVTAFRDEMAVHGRFGKPCPDCGAPVQRIVYAENETNYCAKCQTGGKLLADRALSRLLRRDWPRTLDELEELYEDAKQPVGAGPSRGTTSTRKP